MTRRLWIRAHALPDVEALARKNGGISGTLKLAVVAQRLSPDPNAMVVVHIPDELVTILSADGYLTMCGKVLAPGEEPPYLGSDPGLTEAEGVD